MGLRRLLGPTDEPVSVDELLRACRVDDEARLSEIQALGVAARETVERLTQRSLLRQTWRLTLDTWPSWRGAIALPYGPVHEVLAVTWFDVAGVGTTLDADAVVLDADAKPARLWPAPWTTWPVAETRPHVGVRIDYATGVEDPAAVPATLTQALTLLTVHWFRNPEAIVVGTSVIEVPYHIQLLLQLETEDPGVVAL
ncbi:MAG: hypothetical protein KJ066_19505 [Acidobacteria bacterium]|nr:hypothetical protein [Acidobacteriota bacterium]